MSIIKISINDYSFFPPLDISKDEKNGDISIGGKKYSVRVLSNSGMSQKLMGKLAEITNAGKDLSQVEFVAALTELPTENLKEEQVKFIFESIELANSSEVDAQVQSAEASQTFVFPGSNAFIERMNTKLATAKKNYDKEMKNVEDLDQKVDELAHKAFLGPLAASATKLLLNSAKADLKKRKLEYLAVLTEIYQGHSSKLPDKEEFFHHMVVTAIDAGHLGYLKGFIRDEYDKSKGELRLLYISMIANNAEMIDFFISRGVDPNTLTNIGRSVIEIACMRGERAENAIKALVKAGAKVDLQGVHVPIHEAFKTNIGIDTARLLLDHLDNINLRNENGDSLLYSTIVDEAFHHRMDKFNLLLDRGIDPNIQSREGNAPLHDVVNYCYHSKNTLKMMRALITHGAIVDLRDINSRTALHLAADANRSEIMTELLKNGAKPGLKDSEGKTALHYAVIHNKPQIKALEALLKAGADINAQDAEGNTPLHIAVQGWTKEGVAWLMEHGANPMIRNKEGKLPGENFLGYVDKYHHEIRELLSKPPKL